jgi:hypothetical protein
MDCEDTGVHQENITRKSGKSKTLKIKEEFSIVADGTETMTDFYACLIIVDSAIEIVWMKIIL